MAYRPDGGTVLPARWGRGSPLAGVEVWGVALPATPLCLPPSPGGNWDSSWCSLSLLLASPSGFLRLWGKDALCLNLSPATSLLCDLRKGFYLSELSFRICKLRMIISVPWSF